MGLVHILFTVRICKLSISASSTTSLYTWWIWFRKWDCKLNWTFREGPERPKKAKKLKKR